MDKTTDIKAIIIELAVGQSANFPVERFSYVRVAASNAGLELGRKYKTKTDRDAALITVTREA
jgi:hypothetical protein